GCFHLVALRDFMVDFEADAVAVVGVILLSSLVVAHIIGVIEPNQSLVKGEVDRQRRTQFQTPTFLFLRLERRGGVVIVKPSHRAGERPSLGLLLRRKARRISSLQTGGTKRG